MVVIQTPNVIGEGRRNHVFGHSTFVGTQIARNDACCYAVLKL